eukprot:TRINITY_DN63784_c0_g1_i1.p1 TRINITY_DN63784_c0_g1~~TRINITY_DN63784_c0_g1_i1.p1  ORF type:complete len:197 (+),score=18.71 TRINITY_DN63784_c0_g1_i1:38-592(+)
MEDDVSFLPPDRKKYPDMEKYFVQKWRMFSRFDEGIRLDRESWFSVTPEAIALHTARRTKQLCPNARVILDAFSGAGGNAIAFAQYFDRVISFDLDLNKIKLSQNNAKIYGVQHKIEYVNTNFIEQLRNGHLKADIVFLSPPWGGPAYQQWPTFDLRNMVIDGMDGIELFERVSGEMPRSCSAA